MKNILCKLAICVLIIALNSCKEYDYDLEVSKNLYRIKQISEYNNAGEETSRDVFSYENERVVLWQWYFINDFGEMKESWKIVVNYNVDKVISTKFCNINDIWELDERCEYVVRNNHILEEVLSRYGFPRCMECWKYEYKYYDSKLTEWKSFVQTENEVLKRFRRGEYLYQNNKLVEYGDFVITENSVWKQDYKRTYNCNADKVIEWSGGTYNAGVEWFPTQKIEYSYDGDNYLSIKKYSVWDINSRLWRYFGSLNYFYDENNYLIEKASSYGERTIYTYEEGHGNASLLYYDANDLTELEPNFKSGTISNAHVPFYQRFNQIGK